jgi:hypothetical protein
MSDIPNAFICPITLTIMSDPYSDTDGNTYEKEAIIKWVSLYNTSPITRNHMTVSSLTPNRALKELIENYLGITTNTTTIARTNTSGLATVGTVPVDISDRDGVNIIIIADVSGSMQEICANGNSSETIPYTRLDLVKHAIRAINLALTSKDKLGLVKFNNAAKKVAKLLPSNESNKEFINSVIESLYADGGTNIWDALRVSIEMAHQQKEKTHILLFTDGVDNITPPRGVIPTLVSTLDKISNIDITINTYGFGNNINSELLFGISELKNGIFGFIPDSSMIGTVFINSVAHLMTYNKIQPTITDIENQIRIDLIDALKTKTLDVFNQKIKTQSHIPFVNDILIDCLPSIKDADGQINKAFEERYYLNWGMHYIYSVCSAYINKLCLNFRDHGVQHFKTPLFDKYQKIIEDIFINMPAPKPTGNSHNYSGSPISSQQFTQTFYNSNGVCFTGDTLIKIEGGEFIKVQDITKGTRIESLGKVATVICVLKTKFLPGTIRQNIKFPSTCVTQYHPVFFDNKTDDYEWVFPLDSDKFCEKIIQEEMYVYDFILDTHHIVELGGNVFATTLNHGRTGDVIGHDYFGTHKIIDDLMKHSGWDDGFIQLDEYKYQRSDVDNRICKIVF